MKPIFYQNLLNLNKGNVKAWTAFLACALFVVSCVLRMVSKVEIHLVL